MSSGLFLFFAQVLFYTRTSIPASGLDNGQRPRLYLCTGRRRRRSRFISIRKPAYLSLCACDNSINFPYTHSLFSTTHVSAEQRDPATQTIQPGRDEYSLGNAQETASCSTKESLYMEAKNHQFHTLGAQKRTPPGLYTVCRLFSGPPPPIHPHHHHSSGKSRVSISHTIRLMNYIPF